MSSHLVINGIDCSLTNSVLPFRQQYQGLNAVQKIAQFVKDIFKTIICFPLVVPATTLIIDLFAQKKFAPVIPTTNNNNIYQWLAITALAASAITYIIPSPIKAITLSVTCFTLGGIFGPSLWQNINRRPVEAAERPDEFPAADRAPAAAPRGRRRSPVIPN